MKRATLAFLFLAGCSKEAPTDRLRVSGHVEAMETRLAPDAGGRILMRRTHLRGRINILKRLLIQAGGFNLGLVMRQLIGVGTPRGWQGRLVATIAALVAWWSLVDDHGTVSGPPPVDPPHAFTRRHRHELFSLDA